jgi:hypothetical protein
MIEKGIPAPPRFKYAVIDELQPGDSIVFKTENPYNLAAALQYRQHRNGKHFMRRKITVGFRVWRTS